uniref:Zinc finger, HIT-type containing 1 n=1 Tax=Lates calcarifer TaxID=8187 RepID=A0A4W6E5P4_LATCA
VCPSAAAGQRRVLDEATRQRRLSRQLEALEKDNFQDDPLSSLPPPGPTARLPAFSETEEPGERSSKTRGDHFKQRFRKNFTTLLEEENLSEKPEPNYLSAAAPPSSLPPRHFCCVCGFPSHYTCTTCGGRYCCSKCLCEQTPPSSSSSCWTWTKTERKEWCGLRWTKVNRT